MLHNPKRAFQASRAYNSPTFEARRLRLEYNRLQRRIGVLDGADVSAPERETLKIQVERIARDLSHVRADSVHAVEAKLRVALDLKGECGEPASQRLLSSALADLHYLALLTSPPSK